MGTNANKDALSVLQGVWEPRNPQLYFIAFFSTAVIG